MESTEQLYYALGQLAYAVAFSDGKIQPEEVKEFEKIVSRHQDWHVTGMDYAGIIFQIIQKDHVSVEDAYNQAMKTVELNRHHLTPAMINSFKEILKQVMDAFPPDTEEEKKLVKRFVIEALKVQVHAANE